MSNLRASALAIAAALLALPGCNGPAAEAETADPAAATETAKPSLGVMSSLPLYWPLGASFTQITSGTADTPWQREVLEQRYDLVPLDTLTPIAALSPDEPDTDPLANLDQIAIVQPRGLAPADNAALDAWVRGGGQLLLVLDPALTAEYDLPLGDPQRPVATALIVPVVARWGLAMSFTVQDTFAQGVREVPLGEGAITIMQGGDLTVTDAAAADCEIIAGNAVAKCAVGDGQVTLVADAAVFEHPELAGQNGEIIHALLGFAFD
ncbi:hypothetical protein [Erythrobacter sp. MTPC3]|uniref:hypothetical protein n=1 Tax=Erythrobacter sp. MTPC3 TaxID=3056564 RepID=UPI0036F2537F